MKSFIFRSIFLFILLLSLSILSCNSQHIFQFTQKFPSIQRSRSTFVNFVNQHRTPKLLRFNNDERRSNTISSRIDSLLSPRKKCEIGTCQFYYNCARKTSSPSKFCEMNNGFSGVCCHDNGKLIIIIFFQNQLFNYTKKSFAFWHRYSRSSTINDNFEFN